VKIIQSPQRFIAGGLKAIYEPYHFWTMVGKRDPAIPDVVITGEQYVLLELLNTLIEYRGAHGTMRSAFEQARSEGALEAIPGLVYLAHGASAREPVLIDTGLQRLVRDLDELPGRDIKISGEVLCASCPNTKSSTRRRFSGVPMPL
jgi:hypothetical protein